LLLLLLLLLLLRLFVTRKIPPRRPQLRYPAVRKCCCVRRRCQSQRDTQTHVIGPMGPTNEEPFAFLMSMGQRSRPGSDSPWIAEWIWTKTFTDTHYTWKTNWLRFQGHWVKVQDWLCL